MKKTINIFCIAFIGFFISGCLDNFVSIEVLGPKSFEVERGEGDDGDEYACNLPGTGERELLEGWTDFEDGYFAFIHPFEFRNNIPSNEAIDDGRLDTNAVTFTKLIVIYGGLPGDQVSMRLQDIPETESYLSAVIDSDGGEIVAPLTLIPEYRGRQIQGILMMDRGDVETIVASFFLEGRTNSGRTIRTGTIDFMINVGFESGICDDGRCDCYRRRE